MRKLGQQPYVLNKESVARAVLCLYFVISMFEPYLNGILGSITKYYMFLVMLVLLWKDDFRLKLSPLSILYVVWLAYKMLSLLWTEDFTTPKLHFISQIGMVMYLTVLLSAVRDKKTLEGIKNVYWLASIVLGALTMLFAEAYHGTVAARQVLVIMGVEVDPNNLAALLLVGVAISAGNILYEKRRVIPSVVGLLINVYACFQTSSRSALVTLAVLAVCCVFSVPEKMKFKAIFKRLVVVGVIVAVVYHITVKYLPTASFERLFDLKTYEGGSERDVLWSNAWRLYTRDPLTMLVGSGWGTYFKHLGGKAVHNTLLLTLCDTGIIGAVLFFIPIAIVAIRMPRRKQPMPVLLLLAQMIPAFFIDAINKRFFWNAIIILFMCYFEESKHISQAVEGVRRS